MLAMYQALHAFFLILLVTCEVVKSLSHVQLFATPWTAACQASLSFTISWSLLKLMSIESVMPSNHLILFRPLLLPSILPSIRVFSNELAFCIRWSFSTSTYEALTVSTVFYGFPDSSVGKESACNAGDPCSIPGSGRSAGEGIGYPLPYSWTSLVAQLVKNLPAMQETWVQSLGWEDPLEKGKATDSSILA